MKKLYTLVLACAAFTFASAQTIFDNAAFITHPNGHSTGAHRSAIWDIANAGSSYGAGNNLTANVRLADDFTVPAGDTWNIDSIIFFAYQTQAAAPFNTISTITAVVVQVWDGVPGDPTSSVIWGDTINDLMFSNTEWYGVYRTTSASTTSEARPIMRNQTEMLTPLSLTAGTYWLDWGTTGSTASGPWCPPNTILGQNETGNAYQLFQGTWTANVRRDTVAGIDYGQGYPFTLKGSVISGVNENVNNAQVKVYPNPFSSSTNFRFEPNYFNSNRGNLSLSVYDAIGNLVQEVKNINENNVEFLRGTLAPGFYMYDIKNAENSVAKGKLVIK